MKEAKEMDQKKQRITSIGRYLHVDTHKPHTHNTDTLTHIHTYTTHTYTHSHIHTFTHTVHSVLEKKLLSKTKDDCMESSKP